MKKRILGTDFEVKVVYVAFSPLANGILTDAFEDTNYEEKDLAIEGKW
jgi:aryl-alcohol dehydrogenase-like predicted oxidoreductase